MAETRKGEVTFRGNPVTLVGPKLKAMGHPPGSSPESSAGVPSGRPRGRPGGRLCSAGGPKA